EHLLDGDEEANCLATIDDPVIVGERDVHHRPDLDLSADDDRALDDVVHPEDPDLRGVQDGGRKHRPVDPAVGDGEGAALQLVEGQLAITRAGGELGDGAFDL